MGNNNLVIEREKLQFTMSRVFQAPRERVWNAFTSPELIPRWWGRRKSTTVVDEMDVRIGGKWRYIEKSDDGEYAFRGEYKEIIAPERLVYTFEFEPMPGHITTDHITLEALPDGTTKVTTVTTCDSLEDLDGMINSGMEKGATETWDRLEELLA
jgi:uncharacterized protein YndB with AHSA1/START domain